MTITVRLFAILRERAGTGEVSLKLPPSATVAAARDAIAAKQPTLAELMGHVAFAVNQQYVTVDETLNDGDELAIIPPVSGG